MEQPPQPASVPHWALNLTQLLGQYMDIYNIYTIYMEHPPEIQASVKKHSPTFLFKSIFWLMYCLLPLQLKMMREANDANSPKVISTGLSPLKPDSIAEYQTARWSK